MSENQNKATAMVISADRRSKRLALLLLALALLAAALFSFSLGHYPIPVPLVIRASLHRMIPTLPHDWPTQVDVALFNIRMPRILLGMLVGAGLSLAGATFQTVFRNPMVSPDVLGASSASGFGAALAILLGFSSMGISLLAFLFGLISILMVVLIASRVRFQHALSLILCGLIVSSIFSAALSLLKYLADPNQQLPAITYWLMGSLNAARKSDVSFAAPLILLGMTGILLLRWRMNLLSLSEESARSLGVRTKEMRLFLILCATLMTAAAVSVSGMIGWVGLIIPHFSALLFGQDKRYSLPACAFLGATFLIMVDDLARLLSTAEIPLGILTAFVGAPFFLFLLMREGRR